MSKKIIILGGGVGGLTVAHELVQSKNPEYEIHIYERNDCIGGMARSGLKERDGAKLPTEYCWRIYGPNYDNLREILKQIPLKDNPQKNVHDNLIDIGDYLIADQNTVFQMNNRPKTLLTMRRAFKNIPLKQKWHVFNKLLYCFMISTPRLNSLDRMTWKDYIDPNDTLCHDLKKYIIDIMGPYLGAEATQVNVPSVAKTLESFKVFNRPISVMCGPTNEVWFDHWKHYLEVNGVIFHLNSTVKDIYPQGDTVESVVLSDGAKVTGDIFFCGLSVDSVANMLSLKMADIEKLAQRSHQLMVGIQLYFDKKIILPHKYTALYIPDSPWQLVIEPQGSLWSKHYNDIADMWSVGLCDPRRSGLVIKKPFTECSPEEIKNEVWYQIKNSEFNDFLHLDEVKILDYNLWDTYVFNGTTLSTYEPKFSTNKGTYYLRPENHTAFNNLYFATAYTKTETDMFEMESAAESGRNAARILEKSVQVLPTKRPLLFALYRWVDSLFPQFDVYKHFPFAWFCLGSPLLLILTFVNISQLFRKECGNKK